MGFFSKKKSDEPPHDDAIRRVAQDSYPLDMDTTRAGYGAPPDELSMPLSHDPTLGLPRQPDLPPLANPLMEHAPFRQDLQVIQSKLDAIATMLTGLAKRLDALERLATQDQAQEPTTPSLMQRRMW